MINCTCIVQAGQSPDQQQPDMLTLLNRFANKAFGEDVNINWIPVPAGGGFTAGRPSTSSIISITANEALFPARRETLLRELVAEWTAATGCSTDEVVAVLSDPDN